LVDASSLAAVEPREQRRTLWAALMGVFVAAWPSVILIAALPQIADDLGTTKSAMSWVVTLPLLVGSVLLPTFGKLGDLRGHRRIFLLGLGACGVTALLTACAWDAGSLIVLRTLSQTAGVATLPTAIALMMDAFDLDERPRALAKWAFVTAASPALGLLFGGPLVGAVGWRGVFVIQGVIAVLCWPFARAWLKETPLAESVSFDLAGGVALMVASGAVLLFFDRGSAAGWTSPMVLTAAVIAPVATVVFLRIERRTDSPLMPAGLMARRAFAAPVTAELLCQVASTGVYFSAPLFLHETYGVGVTETALLMVPLPIGMCVGALAGGRLTARIGERSCGMLGAGAMAASMAMFLLGTGIEIMGITIVALAVQGAANGLVRPPMASAAGAALDQEHFGVGMATMRMIGQLGSAVGISMAVTAQAVSGFAASYTAALVVSLGSLVLMTRVVPRPGIADRSDLDAQRRLLDEIETDAALSLPALEG
jgi:MFS family permease